MNEMFITVIELATLPDPRLENLLWFCIFEMDLLHLPLKRGKDDLS